MLKLYPSSFITCKFPSKVFLYLFKLSSSASLLSHPYHFHDLFYAHSVVCLHVSNEVRHFIFRQISDHTAHLTLSKICIVVISFEIEHIIFSVVYVNLVLDETHLPLHHR
jgi:hypothetical protein